MIIAAIFCFVFAGVLAVIGLGSLVWSVFAKTRCSQDDRFYDARFYFAMALIIGLGGGLLALNSG